MAICHFRLHRAKRQPQFLCWVRLSMSRDRCFFFTLCRCESLAGSFQPREPKDDNWTGAEIKSCCRLAALLDVPLTTAAQNVVPVAVTAAESVERLRTWASSRCLSADKPGIFARTGSRSRKRRAISIDPSNN